MPSETISADIALGVEPNTRPSRPATTRVGTPRAVDRILLSVLLPTGSLAAGAYHRLIRPACRG